MKSPDLMFLPSSDEHGFTTNDVMSFGEKSPSAIIRELIQNSLDATTHGATVVQFHLCTVATKNIPGIQRYHEAFDKAEQYRRKAAGGELPEQERMIVEKIQETLNKPELDMLIVQDNGCGLDEDTMKALLSDGVSKKSGEGAGGAFGNGHFSVFPTSDLRYVLYAGISEDGSKIASGHAILATHIYGEKKFSNNGFFLSGYENNEQIYPGDEAQFPTEFSKLFDQIEQDQHGTIVAIPSFNHFVDEGSDQKKRNLYEEIQKAATWNFFPAIENRQLEIFFINEDEIEEVSKEHLENILERHKNIKQNRDFLTGEKAFSSYHCLKEGDKHEIQVLDGKVVIYLHRRPGRTRVNLFRNGMWITNNDQSSGGLPGFYNVFAEHEPFEALILVSPSNAPEFHKLIRNAESPLHNRLYPQKLTTLKRKTLRDAFGTIKSWLKEQVPVISDEPYSPTDFLAFPDESAGASGRENPRFGYHGTLEPIHRRITKKIGPGGVSPLEPTCKKWSKSRGHHPSRPAPKSKPALRDDFRIVAVPTAKSNRLNMTITCLRDCKDMELHLVLDENVDATTDSGIWPKKNANILAVKLDGEEIADEKFISDQNGKQMAVRLGDMEQGNTLIELEYEDPEMLWNAGLRVAIQQRLSTDNKDSK